MKISLNFFSQEIKFTKVKKEENKKFAIFKHISGSFSKKKFEIYTKKILQFYLLHYKKFAQFKPIFSQKKIN